MSNSVSRFSSRVEDYARYRPGYPSALLDFLSSECGLTSDSVVADIGSGTGILSEQFLKKGNLVFGVEPNASMRSAAETLLNAYPKFFSVDGTAESTNLKANSIDFITAAQAFHWFQRDKAREEFDRIIKSHGWVVLIWNERLTGSTPFLRDYEHLLLRYGTDYQKVRHENVAAHISEFFAPHAVRTHVFDNVQRFDLTGLEGRVRSSSYTPEPGSDDFEPMMASLKEIFETHHQDGYVSFEYETKVYYSQLKKE